MSDLTATLRRKFTVARHKDVKPMQPALFFARLPPEIRDRIYIEAFGDRVIHLFRDKVGGAPKIRDLVLKRVQIRPCRSNAKLLIRERITHRRKPGAKPWWNYTCLQPTFAEFFYEPLHGECRRRCLEEKSGWGVGVLGWLLTCRQA